MSLLTVYLMRYRESTKGGRATPVKRGRKKGQEDGDDDGDEDDEGAGPSAAATAAASAASASAPKKKKSKSNSGAAGAAPTVGDDPSAVAGLPHLPSAYPQPNYGGGAAALPMLPQQQIMQQMYGQAQR